MNVHRATGAQSRAVGTVAAMRRPARLTATITLCVLTALGTGCSSGSSDTAASTTSAPRPTNTLPPLPAMPFEMHQRVGLGANWQMIVDSAALDGTTLHVEVQLLNVGTTPFTLPGAASLFAARPGLYKADLPATGGRGDTAVVAAGTTAKVGIDVADFVAISGSNPVLYLKGGALDGSKDTLVNLRLS